MTSSTAQCIVRRAAFENDTLSARVSFFVIHEKMNKDRFRQNTLRIRALRASFEHSPVCTIYSSSYRWIYFV